MKSFSGNFLVFIVYGENCDLGFIYLRAEKQTLGQKT